MTDKHTVRFEPVGIEIEVAETQTVLRAAAEQGIMLMHGCKEGQCASCKSFLLEGEDVEHDSYSTFALPDQERDEGFTLLCRAHVYEDVTIELLNYDEDMIRSGLPIQNAVGTVVSNERVTHDLRHLVLALDDPDDFRFFPGQYVDIALPGTEATRSFSMANVSAKDAGTLEFIIRVYPGGLFSEFLDTTLAVGDRLDLTGPFGVFTLRDSPAELVFVGGGAGMAPILSVLRSLAERDPGRKATFYYGARGRRDLCFDKELRALEESMPGFRYVPALSEHVEGELWDGEVGLVTDVVRRHEKDLRKTDAYVCGPPPMVEAAISMLEDLGAKEQRIFYDKFTTTGEIYHARNRKGDMTTVEQPVERSLPKPHFTDAEAGAKVFPDSTVRNYNYFVPQKRKQTHYEDVTVEVQPDPRHYLAQGWIYGFANGKGGYPLEWTALKAWGSDRPLPERFAGSGGKGYDWPAHGWHEFRDPNEEWELTFYKYNSNVVRQITANVDAARETKAFEQWNPNWVQFVESHVGAWMHVEHGLGLYVFANAQRRAPTNMHNNAISVNSMHRIRTAQDLALYNLTLSQEIEGFDGSAHLEAWNSDPVWQATRKVVEQLTCVDDWCEAVFATNVVFEPLVGELFRSQLVQQAAPRNGDFVTPTVMGAGEHDYATRDLRWTVAMFELLTNDREFADHNIATLQEWLSVWVPRCLEAARAMQPLWSQPDAKPPRFEDSLDHAKSRFSGILADLGLAAPKELSL